MLFWVACEDLKCESNPDVVEEKARLIYEDYISILSPREVRGGGSRMMFTGISQLASFDKGFVFMIFMRKKRSNSSL